MKQCVACGREYLDDVTHCLIDKERLPGNEPTMIPEMGRLLITKMPPTLPAPAASDRVMAAPWTERQNRLFEVVLMCLIAFGTAILSSGYTWIEGSASRGGASAFTWFNSIFRESMALVFLWYILMRRGKSFADIGLSWARRDAGWSVILYLLGSVAFVVVYNAIYHFGLTSDSIRTSSTRVGHILFSGGIFMTTILFQFLNPFFEELIVRAFVMTEIKFLTHSTFMAVTISTLLQTSYHFYQGAPTAIANGGTFLVFSLYYARTNRIGPVILAHLYVDVLGTMRHAVHF